MLSRPPNSVCTNLEQSRQLGNATAFLIAHTHHLGLALCGQGRGSTPNTSTLAGSDKSFFGSLGNTLTLKLGNGCEDMEDEPSGWCCRINILGQRTEPCALGAYCLNDA
jgi:hypothetical protein